MEKFVQISSGRGPKECNLAVKNVLNQMQKEAKSMEITTEQTAIEFLDDLPCSVTLKLKGKDAFVFADKWIGTIQWICKSPFRPFHKRKNWFIAVLSVEKSMLNAELDEKDVVYQSMRGSGPGGQNVNKVSTGVRATHVPTGLAVQATDSRSQHQNKQLALIRLREKIEKLHTDDSMQIQTNTWLNQIKISRGNPKRTFSEMDFRER